MTNWQSLLIWFAILSPTAPSIDAPEITSQGLITLIESVDVPASREGKLQSIKVKEGDYVTRGQLLANLDEVEAQLALKRAELEHQLAAEKARSEIALKSAKLIHDVARNEFQRAVQVKQSSPSSISITEFDRLKLEAEKTANDIVRLGEERRFAEITAYSKEVELHLAKVVLEERQVASPLAGIVVQLHRHEGEWVRVGEKVLRIVRIDRLRVEAFVDVQSTLASLEEAPALLEVAFPGSRVETFSGKIVFVHPEADPVNGQIRIWAEIENRDRMLRPGQKGRLKIRPAQKSSVASQPDPNTTKEGKPR